MINKKSIFTVGLLLIVAQLLNGAEHLRGLAGRLDPAKYVGATFYLSSYTYQNITPERTKITIPLAVVNQYPFLRENVSELWNDDPQNMDPKIQVGRRFTIILGEFLRSISHLKGKVNPLNLRRFVRLSENHKRIANAGSSQLITSINIANVLGGTRTKEEEQEERARAAAQGKGLEPLFIEKCAQELARRITFDDMLNFFGLPAGRKTRINLQNIRELMPSDVLNYVLTKYLVPRSTILQKNAAFWPKMLYLPGNKLAFRSQCAGTNIKILNLNTYQLEGILPNSTKVKNMVLLKNGMLAAKSDNKINIWDLRTYQLVTTIQVKGLFAANNSRLIPLPDNKLVFTSLNRIKIQNLNTNRLETTLQRPSDTVQDMVLMPNGMLASTHYKNIEIWDLNTGQFKKDLQGHTSSVDRIFPLKNGMLVSQSFIGKTLRIWDPKTGRLVATLQLAQHEIVTSAILLPNARVAISLSKESTSSTIRIYDLNTKQIVATKKGAYSSSNMLLLKKGPLVYAFGGTIKLWNPHTYQLVETLTGHTDSVTQMVPLQNGMFATASIDKTIRKWSSQPQDPGVTFDQALATKTVYELHKRKRRVTATPKLRNAIKSLDDEKRQALNMTGWLRMVGGL